MISLGHRTGLFDLMATMPPSTSNEIASRANLSERYVREWLAALVAGSVIDYDPSTRTYELPPEHAASLTRKGPLANLAVYAQQVPLLGSLEELILKRFEDGKGTTYADYPRFHEVMAEDSEQTVVGPLFDVLLPLAPGLTERLKTGIDVLDAGCGRGRALIEMSRRFPESRFVGYDLCDDAIAHAGRHASEAGLTNVTFEVRDLTGLEERERYDLICSFDAVHDQKHPSDYLRRLGSALRRNGVYLLQDIGSSAQLENNLDFPMASLLYAVSCMHCMPVSLGQGGDGLGTMWGWETAESMLREAGFNSVERHVMPHDPMNVWFVCTRGREP
jgi:2-polyprenyl-3-methyl-5-hydroxy-6-metoxy-1,4-benzoquinol methylase